MLQDIKALWKRENSGTSEGSQYANCWTVESWNCGTVEEIQAQAKAKVVESQRSRV